MKFDPKNLALASGSTFGIVYVVCVTAFYMAPDFSFAAASYIFHGIDFEKNAKPMIFPQALGGLALTVIFSYAIAYFFSIIYNYLDTEDK